MTISVSATFVLVTAFFTLRLGGVSPVRRAMDLLWNAYGVPSDQEEDTGQRQRQHRPLQRPLPAPKRFRSEAYVPPQSPSPPLVFPPELSGRYVSKRERAILAAAAAAAASSTASAPLPPPHLHPSTSVASPGILIPPPPALFCACLLLDEMLERDV